MESVVFTGQLLEYIEEYDGVSHSVWNSTAGPIVEVRAFVRLHYLKEQKFRCAYCRIEKKETHGLTWDVEHIIPKSTHPNFLFHPQNLAIACKECNSAKDNHEVLVRPRKRLSTYPLQKEDYRIVHPHFDVYSDHFEITSVNGRIRHRAKNDHKARETYIICNLIRFDYSYAEWEDFDAAIVEPFANFIERCPPDATKEQISAFMRTITFAVAADF